MLTIPDPFVPAYFAFRTSLSVMYMPFTSPTPLPGNPLAPLRLQASERRCHAQNPPLPHNRWGANKRGQSGED